MRIGIDARFLTHPQKGGFKTYTENLILALAGIDKENEYILYLDRQPLQDFPMPNQPNFTFRVVSGVHQIYGMPWREQYSLRRQIKKDRPDLFHAPCLTAPVLLDLPLVVTIHDMIWYYPDRYSGNRLSLGKRGLMRWYYQTVPKVAARRANAVITVSEAARQSILKYLRIDEDRIFVTHEAASSIFRPLEDCRAEHILAKYQLRSNFILGIGSADPRKNIKTLIRAYALLPEPLRQTYQLAIIYNHKSLASASFQEAEHLGILNHVLFLEEVSDQDLVHLYNMASLFVFPSLEEGFGLPPLEAMACGTPVLAANNSSIPEIVGDAALQFSAENVRELTDLISNVLTNLNLQQDMKKRGIDQAATFSWRNCALETLKIYEKVVDGEGSER